MAQTETQDWTIVNAMETGETDATYGTEYVVKFDEHDKTLNKYFQKKPKAGDKLYGYIETGGKYGDKFKKVQREQTGGFQKNPPSYSKPQAKAAYTPNNDGQRQGMCLNNAANTVNGMTLSSGNTLTPRQWATAVHTYASALYSLGDLKELPMEEASTIPASVADAFGIGEQN